MAKVSYKLKQRSFAQNDEGRDFIVGDIHGWFNVLENKLKDIGFDESKDRLFALGDLIDRGPFSHRCLEFLDKPWFFSIRGNHEDMVYEFHNNISWNPSYYMQHGGQWFVDLPVDEKQKYVDRLQQLDHIFEIDTVNGKIGMVHADIPVKDWDMFKLYFERYGETALWSFDGFNNLAKGFGNPLISSVDFVVHGHTSVSRPTIFENRIFIDTGAMTKKLTFLEINNPQGLIGHH
jgi:serine/threonine protein phosphatase 1